MVGHECQNWHKFARRAAKIELAMAIWYCRVYQIGISFIAYSANLTIWIGQRKRNGTYAWKAG